MPRASAVSSEPTPPKPSAPSAPSMSPVSFVPRVPVIAPSRQVHLYSRPHIDLQRVAGALCRS
ncbi:MULTISPECIES: putative leader peptide [unclassified Streptomyces]|uniref:putative leader peptide n=1 Tax=unclassified Streptomyces TaxID=2593676 RepID=UPI0033E011BB